MSSSELTHKEAGIPANRDGDLDFPTFVPTVDIHENDKEVVLVADMPGADADSVGIDLERNVLRISSRPTHPGPEGVSLTHREYSNGGYERTFTLGNAIDSQGIVASVRDGVLRLTLPKAEEAQPRRISVKAG